MSACDECRNDFDAMSRLVESLPDDMKTSDCVLNAKMLLVALAYQKAEKENAKLRELVRDLWKACPADGYYCIYHCAHYDKESESHCKLEDRMRELRVEV